MTMFRTLVAVLALSTTVTLAQSPVSQKTFDKIVHYTAFAGAVYAIDCPSPPFGTTVLQYFNDSVTDTQAALFHDNVANELILSFQGSATPVDLDTDLLFNLVDLKLPGTSCPDCKVHRGFHTAYATIANEVTAAIDLASSKNPSASLTLVGHSLGGALASLAAISLVGLGKKVTTYTYGQPRHGNPAFAKYISKQAPNHYRVTHANDGIPQIPPALLGFEHHGTEYWQQLQTGNTAATTFNCGKGEVRNCNAAQSYGLNPINGAHIAYSDTLIANALFNEACGYKWPGKNSSAHLAFMNYPSFSYANDPAAKLNSQ